jgi:hypothetical protein
MTTKLQKPGDPRRRHRLLARIAFTGSGLLVLFWSLFFAGVLGVDETDAVLVEFEAAFLYADAVLAAILVAAGIGLRRGRRYGRFCLTAGAAMALYLGILDFTFYSRQGLYAPLGPEGAVELLVNLLCAGGGLVALRFSWTIGEERS